MKWAIISLGGSVIAPHMGEINYSFLTDLARLLVNRQQQKGERYAIVTGGGALARSYQRALHRLIGSESDAQQRDDASALATRRMLDRIGIAATRVHAELFAALLSETAADSAPPAPPTSSRAHAGTGAGSAGTSAAAPPRIETIMRRITDKDDLPVDADYLVSGGWYAGVSTDCIATHLALYLKSDDIINISDTACIYSADPRLHPDAVPHRTLNWQQYMEIIGGTAAWRPGAHVPFDPHAAREARRGGITVRFVLPRISELQLGLEQQQHDGTIIAGD